MGLRARLWLAKIGHDAGFDIKIAKLETIHSVKAELVMTYTTLLCLPDELCKKVLVCIRNMATKAIVLVETTGHDSNPYVFWRPPETYSEWLGWPLTAQMQKPGLKASRHTQMLWRIPNAT